MRAFPASGISVALPVFGSSVPTKLPTCTVKTMTPLREKTRLCGSRACASGILCSVTVPLLMSILPIRPAALPVYQMLPSGSSTRPCGPEFAVGSETHETAGRRIQVTDDI